MQQSPIDGEHNQPRPTQAVSFQRLEACAISLFYHNSCHRMDMKNMDMKKYKPENEECQISQGQREEAE